MSIGIYILYIYRKIDNKMNIVFVSKMAKIIYYNWNFRRRRRKNFESNFPKKAKEKKRKTKLNKKRREIE